MQASDPEAVVQAWQEAANDQDIDRLLQLSAPNIEVAGPRGSSAGQQALRDWVTRAGLTLQTLNVFARGDAVVVEQHGIWRSGDTGQVTGDRTVASVFRVDDGRVASIARYDSLVEALAAAGLEQTDQQR
jgi:ketosteroid isomerase-like protein